jgi:hypothetical protein
MNREIQQIRVELKALMDKVQALYENKDNNLDEYTDCHFMAAYQALTQAQSELACVETSLGN